MPLDLEFGPDGRLYVADQRNHRIRAIDLDTGIITTVAGNGTPGFSGDGGAAVAASLNLPSGVEFDAAGRLYIADTQNSRIRRVSL
jgi:sugar lactone lactonase YvrE